MKKKLTAPRTHTLFAGVIVASSLLVATSIIALPNISFARPQGAHTGGGGGFGGGGGGFGGGGGGFGGGGWSYSGGSYTTPGGFIGNLPSFGGTNVSSGRRGGGNYYAPPPVTCNGQTIQNCSLSTNTAGNTSGGSCVNGTVGSCSYACNSNGSWSKVSNSCSPACAATTINGCHLSATAYGGSAGSCSTGNIGSCNYTCNNGTWTKNTNSCTPGCDAATITDPATQQTCSLPTTVAGKTVGGSCSSLDIGSCSAYCAPTGTIQVVKSCGWGGCVYGSNTIPAWQEKTNSCVARTCSGATLNNCALPSVSSKNQGVAGSCTNGTTGSCNYTCTFQGGSWAYGYVWQKNTNSCTASTPPTCTAQFSPTSVIGGQESTTLSWSSTRATSASYTCTGPSPKSGTIPVSGSATYTYPATPTTQTETCTITAQSASGSTGSCSSSVKVVPPPTCTNGKTGSLSATPNRVVTGKSTTLSWKLTGVQKASDVASCEIKGSNGTTYPLQATPTNLCVASGTTSVVVTQQAVYTLYCNGAPVTVTGVSGNNAHAVVNVVANYGNF